MRAESRIRQVKREIRALGIAVKKRKDGGSLVVGVVFRGGLYLDGVMKVAAYGPDITSTVAEMVKSSPHHPQIRVLLLSEDLLVEEAKIAPSKLSLEVMRPLILLSSRGFASPYEHNAQREPFEVNLGFKNFHVMTFGLGRREAEGILRMTTRDGVLPEPLRVADMVSSALIGLDEQKV